MAPENQRQMGGSGFADWWAGGLILVAWSLLLSMPLPAQFVIDPYRFAAPSGYTAYASRFDGTNDYLSHSGAVTGMSDTDTCTFSCWLNFKGGDGVEQLIFTLYNTNTFRVGFYRTSANVFRFFARSSGNSTQIDILGSSTITSSSGWVHVFMVIDTNTEALNKMYVNGVAETLTFTTRTPTLDINWTPNTFGIGARVNDGSNKLNAEMMEFWLDSDQYHDAPGDFASGGVPLDLGSDGSGPTGTQPPIYLRDPYTSFETNYGEGGNLTVNGALTEGTAP